MFCLVSYDIPDDRRRLKLAKTILDFGRRVQYSVFECLIDLPLLVELTKRIEAVVEENEDSVRIYTLCAGCEKQVQIIGQGEVSEDKDVYIL